MKLDATDNKLINMLQVDSKKTVKQMASRINLSPTAVYERIKKLEKNKVIESYVTLINREKIGRSFLVLCQVRLEKHNNIFIAKFEKEVQQFSEVLECYNTSGDYDYTLKIAVENMKEYRKFLNEKLTTLDYIGSTYSTFIICEVKNTTVVEL